MSATDDAIIALKTRIGLAYDEIMIAFVTSGDVRANALEQAEIAMRDALGRICAIRGGAYPVRQIPIAGARPTLTVVNSTRADLNPDDH